MPTQTFFNLSEDKKKLIIDAAVDEFFENGYEKMSIAKMINKARIPRGSFYQYFEDKQDLYTFIIINIVGSKKHSYFENSNFDKMKFLDIMKELFVSGVNFYKDEPKLASIATEFLNIKDLELKRNILGDSQKLGHEFFKNLIENRKSRGEISKDIDTEMLIYFINTINSSFVEYFIEHKNLTIENNDLLIYLDKMLFLLNNGLQSNK
ncbi:TetR/AcrR family transcriptional regulator [Cytobacillus sp.]|uniref:TetR/AcrR family transcriptional regulator n=1 Tax=Cytobacillus sp. TaxID=2675269 RepID=UPI0028BD36DC|nr:TetR/AcrR family transcriptional regulator [Cytobacillus sp.]